MLSLPLLHTMSYLLQICAQTLQTHSRTTSFPNKPSTPWMRTRWWGQCCLGEPRHFRAVCEHLPCRLSNPGPPNRHSSKAKGMDVVCRKVTPSYLNLVLLLSLGYPRFSFFTKSKLQSPCLYLLGPILSCHWIRPFPALSGPSHLYACTG